MCEAVQDMMNESNELLIIKKVCGKLTKGQDAMTIADALEEDEKYVQRIMEIAKRFAPEYDERKIYDAMQ